jgi:signal transduction histidine kinase
MNSENCRNSPAGGLGGGMLMLFQEHGFVYFKLFMSLGRTNYGGRLKLPARWVGFILVSGFILLMSVRNGRADDSASVEADYSQPWQVTSYSKDAGLLQQRFFDIAFTRDGQVWLAADDGLRRFDGFTWNLFGTNNGLPSSFTRAVCVDTQNRLWVGSDAGVGIWDFRSRKYDAHDEAAHLANDNVREIDQDPDGALWFSCDQWPETTDKAGGLTCLKPGRPDQWQTFRQTNGLPMDYVIGYFRDSTGRQFVFTPHGWGQRRGDQWGPPVNPGYEAEDCVLQMAEARDGTLFAQGEHTLLTLVNGQWESHPNSDTRLVCVTRSGEVAAVEYNSQRGLLWFCLWDGQRFVRASAPVSGPPDARLYHLREAPDGSLWCVGMGTVVRWNYHAEKWTLYPHLPPPMGTDARGRVWFADESSMVVYADGHFQTLAPGKLWGLSEAGQAMIWDAQRDALTVTAPQDPMLRTAVETGCAALNTIIPNGDGIFWILGQDPQGNGMVARYENGRSQIIASPEFHQRQLTSGLPLSATQIQLVAHQRNNNLYGVAQLTGDQVEWLPFLPSPPPLTYPSPAMGAGRHWLFGYSGLYEQLPAVPGHWQPVRELPDKGFNSSLSSAQEFFLVFSGVSSSQAGCALYFSNQWHTVAGEFSHPTFGSDKKTIYLPSRNGIFIRKQPGTLNFEYLQIPSDSFVNVAMADPSGTLWLGSSEGTFRYRPGQVPPNTIALASVVELRRGAPLPVTVRGQERFENVKNSAGFRYSRRIDQGRWSSFEPWTESSLGLPELKEGYHLLEVRARDVDGNVDPMPATVKFTILPEPWQKQAWFMPAVVVVAILLAWLVWLSGTHIRQIAVTNSILRREIEVRRQTEAELERARGGLERRVIERTEQLTRSNQHLRHEIIERQQAEKIKQKLEEQLHQSQKMEAIGTLAGGIAHDFNNILAVIIPYCDLVIEELPNRPDLQENLREVLKSAHRAKNLVQQILTFSRRQHQQPLVCDLPPIVTEALKLLRSALPSTIQMSQQINHTHPVLADPTQIHQVIMNLCVNAQHAMEGRQGWLEIVLDEVQADKSLCARNADLHPGLYVRISIRDTGCGIPLENIKRIFDPFFTTRGVGQGTGLGLAVVHGIVKSYNGAILVQSELGKGAEFQVFFPAQPGAVVQTRPVVLPPPSPSLGEHLLIVDDEPAIIHVLQRLMTRAGYRVTARVSPYEALQVLRSSPADINLVLTDLTMPGMNGLEFAGKVYEIRPDLPIVVATGFGSDLITEEQLVACPNVRRVVEKPLNPAEITRLVAELLHPGGQA